MEKFEDKELRCTDCAQGFVWTADSQEYHARQNYQPPKRCPSCRARRRQERAARCEW